MDLVTEKTLRVIGGTKQSSDSRYAGGGFEAGYHTLRIRDSTFAGQRNNRERLAHVPFDFRDKVVLDIGCNIGGMLHELAGDIRLGVGVDFDGKCVNAANLIAAVNRSHNLRFYVFDLQKQNVYDMWDLVPERRIDVCFFLALCVWVTNWREVISFCAHVSDNLLFETNAYPEDLKKESLEYVKNVYQHVTVLNAESKDDPITQGRTLCWCSNAPFRFEDVLAELTKAGKTAGGLEGVEPLQSTGCQRHAYRLRMEGNDFFLGIRGQRDATDCAASRFLAKKGASVVHTIVASRDRNGTSYLVREFVEATTLAQIAPHLGLLHRVAGAAFIQRVFRRLGTYPLLRRGSCRILGEASAAARLRQPPWNSYEERENLLRDVLAQICSIHEIEARGYGFIGAASPEGYVQGEWDSWLHFLEFLVVNEGKFLADRRIISEAEYKDLASAYKTYFAKYQSLFDARGQFLLGDISWSNILVDKRHHVVFTDLEFAMVGDPAFDFSCMWDYYRKPLRYYIEERIRRDAAFDRRAFMRRVTIYEPLKLLFVASYASARNRRDVTARHQFNASADKLQALL